MSQLSLDVTVPEDASRLHPLRKTKQQAAWKDPELVRKSTKKHHISHRMLERAIKQKAREDRWLNETIEAVVLPGITSTRCEPAGADEDVRASPVGSEVSEWIIVDVEECTTGEQRETHWRFPFIALK